MGYGEITTRRLRLRPPEPQDVPQALDMLLDPDTQRWNPAVGVVDAETCTAWCARMADWSSGDHATWHAFVKDGDDFAAYVSIFGIDGDQGVARVGYRVAPPYRGRGLGSESLRAVASWAFAELGIVRLQLEHAVGNPASCRLALAAGFRFEGVLRSSYVDPDGVRHDEHVHGRLSTDA